MSSAELHRRPEFRRCLIQYEGLSKMHSLVRRTSLNSPSLLTLLWTYSMHRRTSGQSSSSGSLIYKVYRTSPKNKIILGCSVELKELVGLRGRPPFDHTVCSGLPVSYSMFRAPPRTILYSANFRELHRPSRMFGEPQRFSLTFFKIYGSPQIPKIFPNAREFL